jgi:hypothetical protein
VCRLMWKRCCGGVIIDCRVCCFLGVIAVERMVLAQKILSCLSIS